MDPEIAVYQDLSDASYEMLWSNLAGVSEEELDWRPHPAANPVRWILGHLIWFEEWVADAIENTGRYGVDLRPTAVEVATLDEARERFDAGRQRLRSLAGSLDDGELMREVDYFGAGERSLRELIGGHALHMAGHRYQVRYVRGAYSRAHGTRKESFDPW